MGVGSAFDWCICDTSLIANSIPRVSTRGLPDPNQLGRAKSGFSRVLSNLANFYAARVPMLRVRLLLFLLLLPLSVHASLVPDSSQNDTLAPTTPVLPP